MAVANAMAEVRRRIGDRIASVIHLAAYYDTTGGKTGSVMPSLSMQGMPQARAAVAARRGAGHKAPGNAERTETLP